MSYDWIKYQLDVDHRKCIYGDESLIFHCHHYNNYLQRTIKEDAEYIDSIPFLVGAAAEMSFHQLSEVLKGFSPADKKLKAAEVYKWAGFGVIDFLQVSESGGSIATPVTHYSTTWKTKFGVSQYPVDFFSTGWIAGACSVLFDKPLGYYEVTQTECISMDHPQSKFVIKPGKGHYTIFKNTGVGRLTQHKTVAVEAHNVDYDGILNALASMPIVGNDEGMIPAFGVYLTRHYANYYNRISFEFVRAMQSKFGDQGREAAEPLLIEAGHQCAFNTFGGIMTSAEWDALIKPQLKTNEDWVHGIVACVNALGWGRWQVKNVSKDGGEFYLFDDYESVGFEAMYGRSQSPVTYLALGGAMGIFNLVYVAGIENKPALTPETYSKFFKNAAVTYTAEVKKCRASGDDHTYIVVKKG